MPGLDCRASEGRQLGARGQRELPPAERHASAPPNGRRTQRSHWCCKCGGGLRCEGRPPGPKILAVSTPAAQVVTWARLGLLAGCVGGCPTATQPRAANAPSANAPCKQPKANAALRRRLLPTQFKNVCRCKVDSCPPASRARPLKTPPPPPPPPPRALEAQPESLTRRQTRPCSRRGQCTPRSWCPGQARARARA